MNADQYVSPAPSDMTGTGRLIFRISTARGAIPLEGARIRVWDPNTTGEPASDRTNARAVLYSDANGKTEPLRLPAPAKGLSLEPSNGNTPSPFACYDADVYLDGYYSAEFICIPIFDSITSIQPADLIPLPSNGREGNVTPEDTRIVEGQNPNL